MSYLNVAEVETALALVARPQSADFTELVALPHRTWEGRTSSALRVHAVQIAFAHSTATVFYVMAAVMAATFVVALLRLPGDRVEAREEAQDQPQVEVLRTG